MNYREAWANGEIEAGTLVDALESQAREIERLKDGQESLILVRDDYKKQAHDYRARWSSAIASGNAPVGAIEAIRAEFPLFDDAGLDQEAHHCEWSVHHDRKRLHALLDGLNQPASGGDERAAFEAWMLDVEGSRFASRFDRTTAGPFAGDYRDGQVQGAWNVWQARAALPVRDHVEDARHMVREAVAELSFPQLSPIELESLLDFHRAICCDSGHTLSKQQVARLLEVGALQSHGFGKHSLTEFGAYLLAAAPSPSREGE